MKMIYGGRALVLVAIALIAGRLGLAPLRQEEPSAPEEGARGIIPDEEYALVLEAAPSRPRVVPRAPRRLLVYSRCFGYLHSAIPYGKVAFTLLGEKSGAWEAERHEDLEVFEAENLKRFDAVLFNNTNNEIFLPADYESLSEEAKKAAEVVDARLKQNLLDFVAGGKGFVVLHAGVATFRKWPEFGELMGARFENHPWNSGSTVALRVDDPTHPVAAAFRDDALPRITDEIYQLAAPFSRDNARVLMSVDLEKTEVTEQQEAAFRRADRDFAMSYVRSYGKGRVFYNAFGHQHEVFWNRVVLQHWLDGVQFALGDLEGDTTPSNEMSNETEKR
jgi:type 1 glutamine amidotransferase